MARRSRKNRGPAEGPLSQGSTARIFQTAIYARLSREDDPNDPDTIKSQIAMLENYIDDRPSLHLAGVFVDNGFTGTDFNRPGWQRLMGLVRSGDIDCILVKDLSRLGRDYIETGEFLEKICPFLGLRAIAINDGFDTETAGADGQLSASLSNIINDRYAKDISRKVSSALQSRMERGRYIGSWGKYGYLKDPQDKGRLIVDPETAPIVQMIYQWRSEGMSYMGINKRLNDMQVPSPGRYRAEQGIAPSNGQDPRRVLWNKHVVTEILHDMTYLGHLVQRKHAQCLYAGIPAHRTEAQEQIVVENTHAPIVDQALFDRVQEVNQAATAATKAVQHKYDYLPKEKDLYGKRFTCSDCGAVMKLVRSISRKKDRAYFTFKCPTYAEHGERACHAKRIRKADLDQAVLAAIRAQFDLFLDLQETLHRLQEEGHAAAKESAVASEIRDLNDRLAHKKALFSGLYRDLRDGLLDEIDYAQAREVLTEEIRSLERRSAELTGADAQAQAQRSGEQRWNDLVERYYTAQEVTAELVDAMIGSMQLDADSALHISFKHMDELKRIQDAVEALRKGIA